MELAKTSHLIPKNKKEKSCCTVNFKLQSFKKKKKKKRGNIMWSYNSFIHSFIQHIKQVVLARMFGYFSLQLMPEINVIRARRLNQKQQRL